jgi:hypothetical protein
MSLALYFFWLLPLPILICVATIMFRRKQHVLYPFFWAYIVFQCLRLPAEFICKSVSYKAFFYAYWISSFVSLVLNLLLLRDIFVRVLKRYSRLDKFHRRAFEIALACLWCTALLLTVRMAGNHGVPQRILRAELVVSFTDVGVFIFVIASSMLLGITWKSALCGIAAGLGLLGVVDLLVFAAMSKAVHLYHPAVVAGWIETLGYNAAIGIFAAYFLPRRNDIDSPGRLRPELLDWAESMKGAMSK